MNNICTGRERKLGEEILNEAKNVYIGSWNLKLTISLLACISVIAMECEWAIDCGKCCSMHFSLSFSIQLQANGCFIFVLMQYTPSPFKSYSLCGLINVFRRNIQTAFLLSLNYITVSLSLNLVPLLLWPIARTPAIIHVVFFCFYWIDSILINASQIKWLFM